MSGNLKTDYIDLLSTLIVGITDEATAAQRASYPWSFQYIPTHRRKTGLSLNPSASGQSSDMMTSGWGRVLFLSRSPLAILPCNSLHKPTLTELLAFSRLPELPPASNSSC